jgi:hypothetical protein
MDESVGTSLGGASCVVGATCHEYRLEQPTCSNCWEFFSLVNLRHPYAPTSDFGNLPNRIRGLQLQVATSRVANLTEPSIGPDQTFDPLNGRFVAVNFMIYLSCLLHWISSTGWRHRWESLGRSRRKIPGWRATHSGGSCSPPRRRRIARVLRWMLLMMSWWSRITRMSSPIRGTSNAAGSVTQIHPFFFPIRIAHLLW